MSDDIKSNLQENLADFITAFDKPATTGSGEPKCHFCEKGVPRHQQFKDGPFIHYYGDTVTRPCTLPTPPASTVTLPCTCDDSVGMLCNDHALEKARYRVMIWLQERYDNCMRIAAQKIGDDKDGWLEDARYFELTLALLRAAEK